MEFFLNQKSLPMVRKCGNCHFFYREFGTCSLRHVNSAYDHDKKIFLHVGENLYCGQHKFRNEDTLRREAVRVEIDSLEEAMKMIADAKSLKDIKKHYNVD